MTPTLDNELDKKIKTIIAKLQRGSFYDSLDDSRRRLNKAEQSILSLLESEVKKAKIEQDKLSRGDEFLWFVRKLREYMNNTTSYKYKVFEQNVIAQQELKYKLYFATLDRIDQLKAKEK